MAFDPTGGQLYIGKGVVSIKKTGAMDWTDMGFVSKFQLALSETSIDYFSPRQGIKQKVRSLITEQAGKLTIVIDDMTIDNLALAVMGDDVATTAGDPVVQIFAVTSITCEMQFIGANEVGGTFDAYLRQVQLKPSGTVDLIGDALGSLTLEGDVQSVSGDWGNIKRTALGSV